MNKGTSLKYSILLLVMLFSTVALAQGSGPNLKNQEPLKVDKLFIEWANKGVPGAAVTVIKDNKTIYSKGFGIANLEYGIPIRSNTVFQVASVSKQFTAFSIALLISQGKLSLNDDIREYLPEIPDFGKKITVANLVYHTSGLRDQWGLLALAGWRAGDIITQDQILKLIKRQTALNFEPGSEFLYSNTNYTLLAEIVKKVTGQSFPQWTKENIFIPLRMKNTFFNESHETIVKNLAYSYTPINVFFKKSILNYATFGATGLYTTAEDLAKWANNFNKIKVGNSEIINLMNQGGNLSNGEQIKFVPEPGREISYAFGQAVTTYKGSKLIYHDGSDAGYRTYIGRFPDEGITVIVLSNLGTFNAERKALEIADIYLKKTHVIPAAKNDNIKKLLPESSTNQTIASSILEKYTGRYEIRPNVVLTLKLENNILKGQITGKQTIHDLVAISDTKFDIPALKANISFEKNTSGQVDHMIFQFQEGVVNAVKLTGFDPKTADLKEFEGEFYSDELATSYKIILKDKRLIAEHNRLNAIQLTLSDADYFSGNEGFFKSVSVIRDSNQKITGIKVSNSRVRNLLFRKVN